MDLSAVFLRPAFFQQVWGGELLRQRMGKAAPARTGESWELCAREKGESIIDGGPCDGMGLREYIARLGDAFWGEGGEPESFPLLIKLIGAADRLSVQVHPSDDNCMPGESGKAEAWVVLDARPGAQLVFGTRCGREEFARALAEGRTEDTLSYLPVQAGDVLNIEAGRLHAITEDMIIYEIQQSSDTTYRFYDWGRVDALTGQPRQLHIDRAMAVTDFDSPGACAVRGAAVTVGGNRHRFYICNELFALERIDVRGRLRDRGLGVFASYTLVEGQGTVAGRPVKRGDTLLVPAAGELLFEGEGVLLKGSRPSRERMRAHLAALGVSDPGAVEGLL